MPFKIRQPGTHEFYTSSGQDFEFETAEEAEQFVLSGGLHHADEPINGYEIVETDLEGYER
jgi:hypothetical protein